jgi:DNA primase
MSSSSIANARDRHNLAEVARRTGIPLSTASGSVTVRCPLPSHSHPDRILSMRLYLDEGRYFCFGCGARGDVVQWVRAAEGISVAEAITTLASGRPIANAWAGHPQTGWDRLRQTAKGPSSGGDQGINQVELPHLGRTPRERVFAALEAAWSYYTYRPLHARGAAYLAERGIDIELLESHTGRTEVGHTPAKPSGLVTVLRSRGFSDDELVDAGLAYCRLGTNRLSDFYRERVLIPLRNHYGELCGLIGRNVGDLRWAKYKNPPRTHAYDKSVNLYQPLPAPRSRDGRLIVVEGTLDAMAIAVAAIQRRLPHRFCPLTQSGRELSQWQVESILKLHPGPILVSFDGDAPGRDSNGRLAAAIRRRGRTATVISLPDGADPASVLARSGPAGLDAWSSHAHLLAPSAAHTSAATHIPAF